MEKTDLMVIAISTMIGLTKTVSDNVVTAPTITFTSRSPLRLKVGCLWGKPFEYHRLRGQHMKARSLSSRPRRNEGRPFAQLGRILPPSRSRRFKYPRGDDSVVLGDGGDSERKRLDNGRLTEATLELELSCIPRFGSGVHPWMEGTTINPFYGCIIIMNCPSF